MDGGESIVQRGTLRIRGQEVPTITKDVPQKSLNFYVDNPRIYSLVRSDGRKPDQNQIRDQLLQHEHVKALIQDIVANDGLIDPVIVRDGDMVVLEGNSRLAAYRFLATKDPIKWAEIRATILPKDIDDKLVFALLGQYHVKGKKDWAPYEKAGFLYRRYKDQGVELSAVAAELGMSKNEAEHLVAVYEFMFKHDDTNRDRWSYYDEFLKSRRIKKARQEYAGFDDVIVSQIKSGGLGKAMDLRDKLPVICAGSSKYLKRFVDGGITFDDAYEAAVGAGGENPALTKLKRFRAWLAAIPTEEDLLEPNKTVRDKMEFELKEIEKLARKLKALLEKKKGNKG